MRRGTGILDIFLALALLATGCGKVDHGEFGSGISDRRIDFPTPLVSVATKADPARATYSKFSSFGVYGIHYPSGNFMGWDNTPGALNYINGAEFKFDGSVDDETPGAGAWVSDPAYYWPKGGKMSFFAWSPYSVVETSGENFSFDDKGLTVNDFNTGKYGDVDLMYSDPVYDVASSVGTSSSFDGIDIVFHHALSSLFFNLSAASGMGANVSTKEVYLWGFSKEGSFAENFSKDFDNGTLWSRNPEWTIGENYYTEEDPMVFRGSCFILPQAIGQEVYAKFYYTLQMGNGAPITVVSQPVSLSGLKDNKTNMEIGSWERGRMYVYNAQIGATEIRFDVDVVPWNNGTDMDGGKTIQD